MLGHIYCRSSLSPALDSVHVATCDSAIAGYVRSIGGNPVLTADTHERASDRTAEAADRIRKETGEEIDTVVMIQGDEPLVTPAHIEAVVAPLRQERDLPLANLMAPIDADGEREDPNVVKVVVDRKGSALYFSREPIPSRKKWSGPVTTYKQTGIIAFRASFLREYTTLPPTPLEQIESVDMLRVLEHGYEVRMVPSPGNLFSVDTPEDRERVERMMERDPLFPRYRSRFGRADG
jgi:3-deoxy-manno-octulosonate cytidylyltransferase (CMP-KDO synthetase)